MKNTNRTEEAKRPNRKRATAPRPRLSKADLRRLEDFELAQEFAFGLGLTRSCDVRWAR